MQEVPDGRKESAGGPWQFIGLMPLFDPPRHDSAETIRRALNLGVNVKMITGGFYSVVESQKPGVASCALAHLLPCHLHRETSRSNIKVPEREVLVIMLTITLFISSVLGN